MNWNGIFIMARLVGASFLFSRDPFVIIELIKSNQSFLFFKYTVINNLTLVAKNKMALRAFLVFNLVSDI
jgi:hypothetical protein